jgi:hypothetical protein
MTLEDAKAKLAKLKELQAHPTVHDQTLRTQVIRILHGPSDFVSTETRRFLDVEVERLEYAIEHGWMSDDRI